ncbi:hypothetical protein HAX54_002001, partial [Datura stramonium]|nr:hypothetical protein [Datura stramonium]
KENKKAPCIGYSSFLCSCRIKHKLHYAKKWVIPPLSEDEYIENKFENLVAVSEE